MDFKTALNNYIKKLNCTSKELAIKANLSETVISRYRNGLRTPGVNKDEIKNLANAISVISYEKKINLNYDEVLNCLIDSVNKNDEFNYDNFCKNFNRLLNDLKINIKDMAKYINFDASYISRIRYNKAKPSTPSEFCNKVCSYVINRFNDNDILIKFLNCDKNINDKALFDNLYNFLINNENTITESKYINDFLISSDDFNLNDFIKAIKFDEIKVPNIPFYKAKTKSYYGIEEMKRGELDFFKATVLSKDTEDIFMCSDMPMEDMAEDISFGKKWMFGIAMCLKKGLHLNIIHNLDRPFNEMMLGLESWIPIYMTGSVSPYYLKNYSNNVYNHLNYTSGSVILTGECINSYHNKGKYYLTNNKKEVEYYQEKAKNLLKKATPLMDIYKNENIDSYNNFLKKYYETFEPRTRFLSSLPLFTITDTLLTSILKRNKLNKTDIDTILNYKNECYINYTNILNTSSITDNIHVLTKEEFKNSLSNLLLSDIFYNKRITYTYEEYLSHLKETETFSKKNHNYKLNKLAYLTFKNITVTIVNKKFVIISKEENPTIHFIIRHPKLVNAISNFKPIVKETN